MKLVHLRLRFYIGHFARKIHDFVETSHKTRPALRLPSAQSPQEKRGIKLRKESRVFSSLRF